MKKMKQAFTVAGYNFRHWHKNPRIILGFVLAFILCFLLTNKVLLFAQQYGTTLQLLEPFIWTFGDSASILLASLLLVFLLSDMPFLSSGTPFYLMRTSRRIWLLGQGLYIAGTTILYVGFILLATMILCARNAFPGNMWSPTAAMLGFSGAGRAIAVPAAQRAMEMAAPFSCAGTILFLMLLYSLLTAWVMLLFYLWKGAAAGMTSVFVFSLFGFLLSPETVKTLLNLSESESYVANIVVGWVSPLNHAAFQMHNYGFDHLPWLYQSIGIFCVLILICFWMCTKRIQTYSFSFTGTEGNT